MVGIKSQEKEGENGFVELQQAGELLAQNDAQDTPDGGANDEAGNQENIEMRLPGGNVGVDGARALATNATITTLYLSGTLRLLV